MKNRKYKLIIVLLCIVILGVGVLCIYIGYGPVRLYDKALAYEAIRMPVDLSRPGHFEGVFRQKYIATHGKQFRFEVDPAFESEHQMLDAFKDFQATLTICKSNGEVVLSEVLSVYDFSDDLSPGCRWYAPMRDYTPYAFIPSFDAMGEVAKLTLDVQQGAVALEGSGQQLVTKNVLCKTESLNVYIGWGIVIVGIVATVVAGLVFVGFVISNSIQKEKDKPETSSEMKHE
ncbi:MAG: hypothetical protein JW828_11780 [Sedimentisphaerales bacterium]|nr:hypothetical protein [Sedimentisphaerales bacterium]